MFSRFIIFLTLNILSHQNVITKGVATKDNYLALLEEMKSFKKSLESINTQLATISDIQSNIIENTKALQQFNQSTANINCTFDDLPSTCAQATKCTRTSGVYNITDTKYSNKTFLAYCDSDNYDGDWLYVLKRSEDTGNFNRSWHEYVNGFGNVAGEFWLGLEKLYALTNFYGPQELNVHLESFEGRKAYSHYDNFVVGNAEENYKLKSLGRLTGTAGDSLFPNINMEFSTYDNDNDISDDLNCAEERGGGFWFRNSYTVIPNDPYLQGNYSQQIISSYCETYERLYYSRKTVIFMIRPRRDKSLN